MKLLAVLFIVHIAVISADDFVPKTQEEINTIRAECQKQLNLSEKDMEELKPYHLPDSERLRPFVHCLGDKMSMFSDEKGFQKDHLSKQLGQYLGDNTLGEIIVQKCMGKFESDGTKQYADDYFNKSFKCLEQDVKALEGTNPDIKD